MTGRLSVAKTRDNTIDGSATMGKGEVVAVVVVEMEEKSDDEIAGRTWRDVKADTRCETTATTMARINACLVIVIVWGGMGEEMGLRSS
mmetsp:Transcript_599/g.1013  ORF Transcript_599/g.1013 Transcript_599/m.1013 type:complete len:89 (-) Transcript_599:12-278(-)